MNSITDTWFAWRPVRLGPLHEGRWAWMRRVWRNRTLGVTIYADLEQDRGLIEHEEKVGHLHGRIVSEDEIRDLQAQTLGGSVPKQKDFMEQLADSARADRLAKAAIAARKSAL